MTLFLLIIIIHCCLEQPSSSSISTTTSSVTSMTSLEQESKAGESASDYEDHWDTDNWGDMEVTKYIRTSM